MGPDGFAKTTALMTVGPIMRNQSPETEFRPRIVDMDEFADFMRRLYVHYYEEARAKFKDADVLEQLHGYSESAPYLQANLKQIASKK